MGEAGRKSKPDKSSEEEERKSKKPKKDKKTKKKKKSKEESPEKPIEVVQEKSIDASTEAEQKDGKDIGVDKEDRKRKREEKKKAKKEIRERIPTKDADGISYTKQQIRRMVRRVQKGLPPLPTPEEEAKLKQQELQLRKEEEMELAGMIFQREKEDEKEEEEEEEEEEEQISEKEDETPIPTKKRKLSKKLVPVDYVCQACQNKHKFPHWIYDCPDKVTVRGTNHVAAGRNGNNAPSAKKVFVSGLFFETKPTDIKAIFQSCGKVTSCKLLKFPDTGRCKGQAFVVFDTEDSARKALALNGTKISAIEDLKTEKSHTPAKPELELKVTQVKSRAVTKGKR